jgi:hypothetical protein
VPRDVNTFTIGPAGAVLELGSQIPQDGLVHLKNLGPNVVWLHDTFAGSGVTVSDGHEGDNSYPMCPGDSVKVRVPEYPVPAETLVPAVTSITTGSTVVFIVEGS